MLAPGGAGGFDFFEVAVRVAFDGGFAVEHLLVGGGVFAALFFVGGHFGWMMYVVYLYCACRVGIGKEQRTLTCVYESTSLWDGGGIDEPRLLLSDNSTTPANSPLFSATSSDKCRPFQCRDGLTNRSNVV